MLFLPLRPDEFVAKNWNQFQVCQPNLGIGASFLHARGRRPPALKDIIRLDPAPPLSRREAAKGERRARIVDAAHELLREVGFESLSVKAVAQRSGLSLSTLYNLFASKDAILAGVHQQDVRHVAALVEEAHVADSLDRIFKAIEISADRYREDPAFYRAILRRDTRGAPDPARDALLREPRMFWRNLLAAAVEDGFLRPVADTDVLNVLVGQALNGATWDWLLGRVSEARFADEAKFACACLLCPFARGEASLRLRKMIAGLHRKLSAEPRGAGFSEQAA
jgi:AcrR family transcriptional regulator